MKQMLFVLFLIISSFTTYAQIDFQKGNWYWNEILEMAEEEDKIIFIDAYTTWCGPCKWMDRNVFSNYRVGKYYNENFISIKVNMESNLGRWLAREYNINSYPTLLFIKPSGRQVRKKIGSVDANYFLRMGKSLVSRYYY